VPPNKRVKLAVLLPSPLVTLFIAIAWSPSSPTADSPCLAYEPDTVSITGVLTRKTFPGPPNYESVKQGDAPETGFYLVPGSAICMVASSDSDSNNIAMDGVRLVQLVLDEAGYARLRPKLGQQVTLQGTLFAEFTGYHHAPLLLRVTGGP